MIHTLCGSSLSPVLLRLIHDAEYLSALLSCVVKQYLICEHTTVFSIIHQCWLDVVGYFHLLAIMTNAIINIQIILKGCTLPLLLHFSLFPLLRARH